MTAAQRAEGYAQEAVLTGRPVVCVANGFQTNYERGFCNALASKGVQVTLISSDATDRHNLSPNVRTINLRRSQDDRRPRWKKLLNLLRYHLDLFLWTPLWAGRIIHMIGNIDPPIICGVFEGLWFRIWSNRYVLTVHDLLPHGRHTDLNHIICRWSYHIPHRLVVHTERMKRKLVEQFGVQASKIIVMQHGIEPVASEGVASKAAPTASDIPTILVFGKMAPYKGVDLLLEALAAVTFRFHLVMAGASPHPGYHSTLKALVESHPSRANIVWRDGFVSESEMEALFQSADLLALPYRHIDQSGVLFQALRFGVPVLATRVGSFDEFVTPEVGEIVDTPTVGALKQGLDRWSVRRPGFSAKRIRAIGKSFEWPLTVNALRAAYGQ